MYLISALSPTKNVPSAQPALVGGLRRHTSGAIPSKSSVTINASLWALPAASNSISGFQANTTKAANRARGLPAIMRPSSHQTRTRLTTWTTFISSL